MQDSENKKADLHAAIINLPTMPEVEDWPTEKRLDYKCGHRDARHAAAELVAAHQADQVSANMNLPCSVLDVGFKYEGGVHVPTVLIAFQPDDYDSRDKFAAVIRKATTE